MILGQRKTQTPIQIATTKNLRIVRAKSELRNRTNRKKEVKSEMEAYQSVHKRKLKRERERETVADSTVRPNEMKRTENLKQNPCLPLQITLCFFIIILPSLIKFPS